MQNFYVSFGLRLRVRPHKSVPVIGVYLLTTAFYGCGVSNVLHKSVPSSGMYLLPPFTVLACPLYSTKVSIVKGVSNLLTNTLYCRGVSTALLNNT